MVAATFKLRCFPQAKASKRRLKPATTSIYKKKIFLTVPKNKIGKKYENLSISQKAQFTK